MLLGGVHFLMFVNFMWKNTGNQRHTQEQVPFTRCHHFLFAVGFHYLSTFHLDTFIVNE